MKLLFKLRYFLMPSDLKKGSWLVVNGDFINIDELWRKSRKKDVWFIQRIEYVFKGKYDK